MSAGDDSILRCWDVTAQVRPCCLPSLSPSSFTFLSSFLPSSPLPSSPLPSTPLPSPLLPSPPLPSPPLPSPRLPSPPIHALLLRLPSGAAQGRACGNHGKQHRIPLPSPNSFPSLQPPPSHVLRGAVQARQHGSSGTARPGHHVAVPHMVADCLLTPPIAAAAHVGASGGARLTPLPSLLHPSRLDTTLFPLTPHASRLVPNPRYSTCLHMVLDLRAQHIAATPKGVPHARTGGGGGGACFRLFIPFLFPFLAFPQFHMLAQVVGAEAHALAELAELQGFVLPLLSASTAATATAQADAIAAAAALQGGTVEDDLAVLSCAA
ncbi:unnamed protein product [Closterium sp. Naga37s-1]|nr:unnamed protein product [Closterium sp. Naga37s-1]